MVEYVGVGWCVVVDQLSLSPLFFCFVCCFVDVVVLLLCCSSDGDVVVVVLCVVVVVLLFLFLFRCWFRFVILSSLLV